MINLYSGTPGSGKSLHVAQTIMRWITFYKSNVIVCNMAVNRDFIYTNPAKAKVNKLFKFLGIKYRLNDKLARKKERGVVYSIRDFSDEVFNPDFFYRYAFKHHVKGKESQTLLVFDEAQNIFNPTVVKEKNNHYKQLKAQGFKTPYKDSFRNDWIDFFTQHRHLGYDIIFVSQFDKLIDAQIRCLFEYNRVHRKINNYSLGMILDLFGIKMFLCTEHWYGAKLRCGQDFFTFKKKHAMIYDSYNKFEQMKLDYEMKKNIENAESVA